MPFPTWDTLQFHDLNSAFTAWWAPFLPASSAYWSLAFQAMPYLFAGVDTVFIPVVVQQSPTFAQCCQILHNRVQSFFFICKRRTDNWSTEGNLTPSSAKQKIQHHICNHSTQMCWKSWYPALPLREALQDCTPQSLPAHCVYESLFISRDKDPLESQVFCLCPSEVI